MFEEILNTLELLPVARGESWTELRAGETEGTTMGGIFISYRRDDATGYVYALRDRLAARFGPGQIFMDIDSIEPGLDFVEVIESSVASCDVVLALIGKRWLQTERLQDPRDFVRLEIQAALARKIRVIPVLLEGTEMPSAEELPDVLSPLSRRQAFEISNRHFSDDLNQLGELLGRILAEQESKRMSALLPQKEPLETIASTPRQPAGSEPKVAIPPVQPERRTSLRKPAGMLVSFLSLLAVAIYAWFTITLATEKLDHSTSIDRWILYLAMLAGNLPALLGLILKIKDSAFTWKAFLGAGLWQIVVIIIAAATPEGAHGDFYMALLIFGSFASFFFFLAYRYRMELGVT
ncbi:MAG TPA: toll/interleukin-1 receptor domain-containing protein [Thermoanaerobaculia bacterium]|nr:toll/interleukin-1 receptor domain-containing protein [Thermoanaerobaculia bacterium]